MADDNATRSQRKRRHANGDHSMCSPSRCRAAGRAVVHVVPASDMPGIDRDAELAALIGRLIGVHIADPANAAVARELRSALLALPGTGELDPVEKIQAEVAFRREAARRGIRVGPPMPANPWRKEGGDDAG